MADLAPAATVEAGGRFSSRMAKTAQTATDVIELLTSDHKALRALLKEIENEKGAARSDLLEEIHTEFMVHSDVEEQHVYPLYKKAADKRQAKVDVAESLEEHRLAKETLADLMELGVSTIEFDAKLKLFKEMVEHHADEEEKDMFPDMRAVCSNEQLRTLSEQVQAAKEKLESKYA